MKNPVLYIWRSWDRFWFAPRSSLPLDFLRIGLGAALLWNYAVMTPELDYFYGPHGVIPLQSLELAREKDPWMQSVFFLVSGNTGLYIFHALFLSCLTAFIIGWKTAWVKWVVFVGHVSYLHRNPSIYYGADNIASSFMFILCLSPVGRRLSMDARPSPAADPDPRSTVCIRFVQLQLCILYLLAGLEKLQGQTWWSGDAVWIAMNNWEFANVAPDFFARHYYLINLLTYGTLAFEISYPFLIWNKSWRPWLITSSVLMHLGIGWVMGLWWFAFVMCLGNLAFVDFPAWEKLLPRMNSAIRSARNH